MMEGAKDLIGLESVGSTASTTIGYAPRDTVTAWFNQNNDGGCIASQDFQFRSPKHI